MSGIPSARVFAAVGRLTVDATTAEVVRALEADGVSPILLKGPALCRALDLERSYGDADLLVAPAQLDRAGEVLARLGFRLTLDHREHGAVADPRAQEWKRGSRDSVDLHWRIAGVAAPPADAWALLNSRTEAIELGRAAARTLDATGVALVVALHAAHHGETLGNPLRDLDRALERIDHDGWRAAAALARELDATEAFAAGLRLRPVGAELARELELPTKLSPRRRLMASSQPAGSLGLLRIADARGHRLRAIRDELLPAPEYMRAHDPRARRGRGGLALAYAARLASRGAGLPRALTAVRAARRGARIH